MTGSANNPDTYGQSTTGNANQIEDGVDFPHSGIIKALSDGLGQNYAIDGFDISGTNATALTVAAGKIFRDGQLVSVSGASLTLSSTYTNGYHLLVAPSGSTPTVVLRNPSAVDKVPDITSGDTIIAVITHTGVNPCSVQFLTVHKREHSLSIGRNNSSVYTEGLTIKSNAGDVEIEAKEQDKDIIFKVNDGGTPTEIMRIDGSTSRVGVGTDTPLHTFHAVDRTNDFPYRFEVLGGNLRINKFGHLQIQNENSGDANATSFDDPFWQIAQRDTGELDIAFGTPGTGNSFVGSGDDIISMKRASNSATGAKQIGFLGATAVSRPAAPSAVSSIASTGGAAPADPEANADAINALITALTNLGLIG